MKSSTVSQQNMLSYNNSTKKFYSWENEYKHDCFTIRRVEKSSCYSDLLLFFMLYTEYSITRSGSLLKRHVPPGNSRISSLEFVNKSFILSSHGKGSNQQFGSKLAYLNYFKLPLSSIFLCRTAFIYFPVLQDYERTNRNQINSNASHGLKGKLEEDSNRYSVEFNWEIGKSMDNLCSEHAIDPPWFIKPTIDGKQVLLLKPYSSKDRMYRRLRSSILPDLRLSRTQFLILLTLDSTCL